VFEGEKHRCERFAKIVYLPAGLYNRRTELHQTFVLHYGVHMHG